MNHPIDINKTLEILGIKPATKRVLEVLVKRNDSSAADLATELNMPKSSVYDALNELLRNSLIIELSGNNSKRFAISDTDQLARIHAQKMKELSSAHTEILSFIQSNQKESYVAQPKIKFYSGIEGVRQAFRDMPWHKDCSEAYLMWPMKDMLETLDEEFLKHHSEQRLKYNVLIKSIRKNSDKILQDNNHAWLESNKEEKLREVKYAPESFDWKMSYWIYGDKCLFASGGSEKCAFVIHSKEFSSLMKLLWDQVWNISTN